MFSFIKIACCFAFVNQMVYSLPNLRTCKSPYNNITANVGVWLCGASYCNQNDYFRMVLGGPAKGFVVKEVLYDKKTDVLGYAGILPSTRSIYVVFRGTSSILNWVDDFEIKKVPYTTFPLCECNIHKGFYTATQNLAPHTITVVNQLKKEYGYSDIIITGHSLGAAISQIMAMEMISKNLAVDVYNYGQPRVGDEKFAIYSRMILGNYWRITHNRDMVPHVPPRELGYLHSCGEVFENGDGILNMCSITDCEDPKCADQYKMIHTNAKDHEIYLGHNLDCGASF